MKKTEPLSPPAVSCPGHAMSQNSYHGHCVLDVTLQLVAFHLQAGLQLREGVFFLCQDPHVPEGLFKLLGHACPVLLCILKLRLMALQLQLQLLCVVLLSLALGHLLLQFLGFLSKLQDATRRL